MTKSPLIRWGVVLGGLFLLLTSPLAAAEPRPVSTVLTVKLKGDRDTYLQQIKKLMALAEKAQTGGKIRVWRASLAGDSTGMLFVAVEYASLEAMAKGMTKMQGDDEWRKLVKEVDQSGVREVVSSMLIEEITP